MAFGGMNNAGSFLEDFRTKYDAARASASELLTVPGDKVAAHRTISVSSSADAMSTPIRRDTRIGTPGR